MLSVTHNHFTALFPGLSGWASAGRKLSSGLYGAREDIRGRHTNHPAGCHSVRTNQRPTSIISPFLCRMPFLPQPSHFILAWERHQICWLAYPVAWFCFSIFLFSFFVSIRFLFDSFELGDQLELQPFQCLLLSQISFFPHFLRGSKNNKNNSNNNNNIKNIECLINTILLTRYN